MDESSMESCLGRTYKQRMASLIAGLAFLSFAFSSAFAFAPTVSPSVSTDGSYTVTYPDQIGGAWTWLEERVGTDGVWTPIFTVSPVVFTGKAPGTYYYRTVSFWFELICGPYECSGAIEHYDVSDAVSVIVIANAPPLDSHEQQTQYQYEFRRGDLDGDGLADLYIKRVSGGVSGNGVLEKTILRGNGAGGFTVVAANSTSFAIADGWPMISVKHAIEDINLDGYVDIVVKNIAPLFNNANGQIVLSSGQPFVGQAQHSTSIDSNVSKFFRDVHAWMFDPAYFDQAITPSAIGYNVKINRWLEVCDYYLGCQSGPYMQPVDLGTFTLAQLGLSSPIDSNDKIVVARQAIAGQAASVGCYFQDWNCNPWCGWIYHGWGSGYEFFWWVDEWAQTVVPGEIYLYLDTHRPGKACGAADPFDVLGICSKEGGKSAEDLLDADRV